MTRSGIRGKLEAAGTLAMAWIRVLLLCSYPILGTAIAFYFSAFSDQGVDLLLDTLPNAGSATSVSDHPVTALAHVALSAASVVIAALSIWWPARLLVRREFRFFPVPAASTSLLRKWLPRVLAALVVAGVAVGYARIAWRFGIPYAAIAAGGWAAATVALCVVFANRHNWLSAARGKPIASDVADAAAIDRELPTKQTGFVIACIVAYALFALAFAALPVGLARTFGGTALIFFGVGGITFIVTMAIAYLPLARGHPTLTVLAAAAILLFSTWLDNHQMWRSDFAAEDARTAVASPAAHARAWAEARRAAPCERDETPVVYLAAAGGGIRAGYWTARVLEELSSQVGRDFDCSLFAMSGVSGGSLGVAGYLAFNLAKVDPHAPAAAAGASGVAAGNRTTTALGRDFLSPAVAGLLFYDAVQRVLPVPFHALDRSRGLENAFERAFDSAEGAPFRHTLRALGRGNGMTPMVFLNSTVVEDGRRAIASNVDVRDFVDVYDLECPNLPEALAPTTSTISLAGAVHNSARFTYVSPAGRISRLGDCLGEGRDARLVDGGYFENSGAATLVQLICLLGSCDQSRDRGMPVSGRPILLLVRNSPGTLPYCDGARKGPQCLSLSRIPHPSGSATRPSLSTFMPEITSPLRALLTVREQRERLAVVAAAEEFRRHDGVVIEAYLPLDKDLPEPPLGWSLSSGVRAGLDTLAKNVVAACQSTLVALFAGKKPDRECDEPNVSETAAQRATDIATKRPSASASASSAAKR